MIPLGTGEIPATSLELADRIQNFLNTVIIRGSKPVVTSSYSSPETIDRISINLTGSECGDAKLSRPSGFVSLGTVTISDFEMAGNPALVFDAPVTISTKVTNLPMSWNRDDHGNLWLIPSQSEPAGRAQTSGAIELAAQIAEVERAARVTVARLAEHNGAKLKDFSLRIEGAGPRGVAARVDISAAKFMMTAKLYILAEVMIDDAMNLRIGQLEVKGDGAAGGMIANMLSEKIRAVQGKVIPLGQFMFAGASLKDIRLSVDDRLRLTANFG